LADSSQFVKQSTMSELSTLFNNMAAAIVQQHTPATPPVIEKPLAAPEWKARGHGVIMILDKICYQKIKGVWIKIDDED
jgi:hypothetical protein